MSSELPGGFDYGTLKTVSMILCFAGFVAILLWLGLSRSNRFRKMSRLPLEDDPPSEEQR